MTPTEREAMARARSVICRDCGSAACERCDSPCEEGYCGYCDRVSREVQSAYARGRAAGIEEAAKVTKDHADSNCGESCSFYIEDEIRALLTAEEKFPKETGSKEPNKPWTASKG